MAGANQLLPGFNHNVTHRGRQYHVQTEDTGTANPHVITHLFLGGNVLASKKTSYAELVSDGGELAARVRQLMEAQHKDMLRHLVRGAFDDGAAARAFQPGEIHVAAPAPATPVPPADDPPVAELPPPAIAPIVADAAPRAVPRAPRVVLAPELAPVPARASDGWGPPVLPRVNRSPPVPGPGAPPPLPAPEPGARRLDELILSYLAGDLAAKRDDRR